jgi:hypothetical protein
MIKGKMKTQKVSSSLETFTSTGDTLEQSVTELNQELGLNPEDSVARQALYETMQKILRKDAFLAYLSETNTFYTISTPTDFQFIHPKDRAIPEQFPHKEFVPSQSAISWLGWSIIGLIPAGVGTMVIAPLAMVAAIKLLRQQVPLIDHRRAWIVLGAAIVLWLFGLAFFIILILHMV